MEDNKAFSSPKPVRLIERIVRIAANDPDDIVLDSFAGSGTTGHAVMRINEEDDGTRRFVLVQQPFDTKAHETDAVNICKTVTRERLSRVANGHTEENGKKKTKVPGLGGSFTYARVSEDPLFGEYRDLGERLPAYNDIAKYVFYTETSRQWNPKDMDKKIGRIGQHAGQSYYLLYKPNRKFDWGLDEKFLTDTVVKDPNPNLVVYCEKIWVHQDQLRKFRHEHGKRVRPMLVPFNLK